jgi:N-acetyl-alpha-D-muramate 1-phosphate uridylyltransferase
LQAVILAGGLGTRLKPMTETIPKALTPVLGTPFIDYQVKLLRGAGVKDFVVCIGHLGEMIESHLGDGRRFGVRVDYSRDGPELLGPAGALKRAESHLQDSFFVTYGDAYLRAPYPRIMDALLESDRLGLMVVFRNNGRYGRSDIVVESGMVTRYDKKRSFDGMNWINFGVSALRKQALRAIPDGRACGEEEFYGGLIREGQLMAYPVADRFYEIGTPSTLAEFERFISREPLNQA